MQFRRCCAFVKHMHGCVLLSLLFEIMLALCPPTPPPLLCEYPGEWDVLQGIPVLLPVPLPRNIQVVSRL